jgi:hypothetical protein
MSDESKEKLVKRMDKVADALLAIVEKEGTSEVQKGRLFTTVQSWMKLRQTLQPSGEGDALRGMTDAIKSKGNRGNGSAGRAGRGRPSSSSSTSADGKAIAKIIRNLPKPAVPRNVGGDTPGAERESGGLDSDGIRVPPNGVGDVGGNMDGVGNLN